ncbi:Transcription initiation factor TFIID subunit [Dirofilaria immitis]
MNMKVIIVSLIIAILLWQIDAGRSKSRKKTIDRDSSEHTSSGFTKNDDDDDDEHKKDKEHGQEREYKTREKKDKKSSSSSEEDNKDKDERNGTAVSMSDGIHRAKRSVFNEKQISQSTIDHGTRVGRAAVPSSNLETKWHENGITGK